MYLTRQVVKTQAAESVVEFLLFCGRLSQLSLKFLGVGKKHSQVAQAAIITTMHLRQSPSKIVFY